MSSPDVMRSPLPFLLLAVALATAPAAAFAQDLYVDSIGHDLGSTDARVAVIEFSDFGCHFCRQFHLESFDSLYAEYTVTGKVRWKYVTFVSGLFANSRDASLVAECVADQGLFEAMRDMLFREQEAWKKAKDPGDLLLGYAQEVGADTNRVAACLANGDSEKAVTEGTRLGFLSGVRGTPTFVVDGFPIQGALPLAFFRDMLDRRLASVAEGDPTR